VCGLLFLLLLPALFSALPVAAQKAPLIEVLPREEHARQLALRADVKTVRKRFLEAIELYREALEYTPGRAVLLNKLGIAYHQVLDHRNEEKYYKKAIRADKTNAHAWNNLGTVQYGKRSYKAAMKSYTRAIELNPMNAAMRSNLGTALFATGRNREAMEQYRLALLIDPEVFEQRGHFGVVMQERTVEDHAKFYLTLAKTFAGIGYVSKALHFLRRAMENGLTPKQMEQDDQLASLRHHPLYQELLLNPPAVVE